MAKDSAALHSAADIPGSESPADIENFETGENQVSAGLEADMDALSSGVSMGGDFVSVPGIIYPDNMWDDYIGGGDRAMTGLDSDGTPFFSGEDGPHLSGPDNQRGMDAMAGLAGHGGGFDLHYVNEDMHIQPLSDLGIDASSQADSEVE